MKCTVCGAELDSVSTDLPFKVTDITIVILKNLPILQCVNPNDPITQAAIAKAVSMDSNRSRTRGLSPTSRVGRPLG